MHWCHLFSTSTVLVYCHNRHQLFIIGRILKYTIWCISIVNCAVIQSIGICSSLVPVGVENYFDVSGLMLSCPAVYPRRLFVFVFAETLTGSVNERPRLIASDQPTWAGSWRECGWLWRVLHSESEGTLVHHEIYKRHRPTPNVREEPFYYPRTRP